METHNIISTPDITGNIGSCTTMTKQVMQKKTVFREYGYTIATNSCTGEVTKTDYQTVSIFPTMMLMICATIVLYAIFKKPDNVTSGYGF